MPDKDVLKAKVENFKLSYMNEVLEIKKYNVLAAHKKANADGKILIEDIFGKEHFIISMADWEQYIMARVNSFEDACKEKGIDSMADKFQTGDPDDIAYQRGKVVCDVLNGPYLHTMKDLTSKKWYCWMEKTTSGFRLDTVGCGLDGSGSTGGPRLRLCSEKLARHFFEKFQSMMAPFWW
jgi:hypothetical protein